MKAVQHLALNCKDLKAQAKFYQKHFGFKRARVFNEGTPNEFVMLRLGTMCLELFQATNLLSSSRGSEQPLGFKHLAFEVSDLDKTLAALREDGIQTENIIDCSSIVNGMRVSFFDDPEGNRLELMQGYQDQSGL